MAAPRPRAEDPFATLRALIRAAMTPADRREFDEFVQRLQANDRPAGSEPRERQ